jgi:superfamily II DNA or RNA helicase
MTGLEELAIETEYRTGSSDPVGKFYVPCLSRSTTYLRAAGYFRSSVLRLMGPAYLDFAKRGGRATLVCSPELDKADIDAILAGEVAKAEAVHRSLLRDIDSLLEDPSLAEPSAILAFLVTSGALEVLIAYPPETNGIYHEKIGCFGDEHGSNVTFIGSSNETLPAWSNRGNFESIEVFCSWHSTRDLQRVEKHKHYLAQLVTNRVPGLEVIKLPEAARRRLFDRANLDQIEASKAPLGSSALKGGRTPLPHQTATLEAWRNAGSRGIAQHATGSGKTFTAILAVMEHLGRGQPALVLVPSQLLLAQWHKEVLAEIPDAVVLLAGGGNLRWKEKMTLAAHTSPDKSSDQRVTIAVMATASSPEFRAKLLPGAHLLVVADEVHQTGSPEYSNIFRIESGSRLGLSATPNRHGDAEGTSRMLDYFGAILQPVITLQDAIKAGRLVPYRYHPHPVRLNQEEADEWQRLTRRLIFLLGSKDSQSGTGNASEEAKLLLIRRSRIAKRAAAKAPLASRVIAKHFNDGQRWLVYCEDISQMNEVSAELASAGFESMQYHSAMTSDKVGTLRWFDTQGGILLSVRCLDEGVDIPSVTHALILASSQNPRQFIQRRGRVLRKSAGKEYAELHDAIVLPVDEGGDPIGALESEFIRALDFAKDAINASCQGDLMAIALASGIDVKKHYPETEEDSDEHTSE